MKINVLYVNEKYAGLSKIILRIFQRKTNTKNKHSPFVGECGPLAQETINSISTTITITSNTGAVVPAHKSVEYKQRISYQRMFKPLYRGEFFWLQQ